MGKLTAVEHLTLDGVMQAPGAKDEDTRGGFEHGGWAVPDDDEVLGALMAERMRGGPGTMLLGRLTYERFAAYWPHQKDNPYTDALNRNQKYVASRTLEEPLQWQNSTLLKGDVVDAVTRLKDDSDNITLLGSGDLMQTLMRHRLVDQFLLLIHPHVLGSGRRLFTDASLGSLRLVDAVTTTTTGVIVATYAATDR
jgi:dihydrofolate reductase